MKMTLLAISVLCLLSSCAPKIWIKDEGTLDQFKVDKMDCQRVAGSIAGSNPLIFGSAFKDCMYNLEYEYVTEY